MNIHEGGGAKGGEMATRSLFSKLAPQARPPEPEVVRPAQAGRNEGGAHWGARASARTPI